MGMGKGGVEVGRYCLVLRGFFCHGVVQTDSSRRDVVETNPSRRGIVEMNPFRRPVVETVV